MLQARKHFFIRNQSRYDALLLSYVILLFFGTVINPDFTKAILDNQMIAKFIMKPVTTVIEIVKFAVQAPLKFILPTDQSSPSSTLGTWFLHPRGAEIRASITGEEDAAISQEIW
jgi:hypothetical protein